MAPTHRIAEWLSEVDNVALSATVAGSDAQAGHVRAMCMLMRMRPKGLGGAGICPAGETEVMRNVAIGAFESAALRLLPSDARVMTSTPGPGRHMATVRLDGQRRESTSSGSTFALALTGALALSLVEHYHELDGALPH